MKGIHRAALATVVLLTFAGRASAVPIDLQIEDSDLYVLGGIGVGDYNYSDNTLRTVTLDEGASQLFNFGHVDILDESHWTCSLLGSSDCATATGSVEFSVDLSSPLLTGGAPLSDIAFFGVLSQDNDGYMRLAWGSPSYVDYSYGGASGGTLSLDMSDIGSGLFHWSDFQDGFDIWGTITNVRSPVGVPEPGMLLLLGSGLLAAAAARPRRLFRV